MRSKFTIGSSVRVLPPALRQGEVATVESVTDVYGPRLLQVRIPGEKTPYLLPADLAVTVPSTGDGQKEPAR